MDDFLLIVFAASIATCPSLFVKKYIKNDNIILLFFAMICYSILIYTYTHIYRKKQISTAYPTILTLQIIFISLIALLFFKEKINKNKIIGLTASIVGITFLTYS